VRGLLLILLLMATGCSHMPHVWAGLSVVSEPDEIFTGRWKDSEEKGYVEPEVIPYRANTISIDVELSWEEMILNSSWEPHTQRYIIGVMMPLWTPTEEE